VPLTETIVLAAGDDVKVRLSAPELAEVAALLRFASETDRRFAIICGAVNSETVTWITTANRRLATIRRGTCDADQGQFAIPKRDFHIAAELCRMCDHDYVEIDVANGIGSLMLPDLLLQFASRPIAVLDTYNAALQLGGPDRYFQVGRAPLAAAVQAASATPPGLTDSARKRFWLTVQASQGVLVASAAWFGHPDTSALVRCQATADAIIALDPGTVLDLVAVAAQDELQLQTGPTSNVPLRLATDRGLTVLVMPDRSAVESLRPHFEAVFAEILDVLPNDLKRDEAGDYPLTLRSGGCAYVRLEAADQVGRVSNRIRIFTSLAGDIEPNLEALTEVNLQNQRCRFGRMYIVNSQLYLETDLTLEEVNRPQLQGAIETVEDLVREVGPLMQAFFGRSATRSPSTSNVETTEEDSRPETNDKSSEPDSPP